MKLKAQSIHNNFGRLSTSRSTTSNTDQACRDRSVACKQSSFSYDEISTQQGKWIYDNLDDIDAHHEAGSRKCGAMSYLAHARAYWRPSPPQKWAVPECWTVCDLHRYPSPITEVLPIRLGYRTMPQPPLGCVFSFRWLRYTLTWCMAGCHRWARRNWSEYTSRRRSTGPISLRLCGING